MKEDLCIRTLLDARSRTDERVRAAMLLRSGRKESAKRALEALLMIATDATVDPALFRTAGASVAALRVRHGTIEHEPRMDFCTAAFEGFDEEGDRILASKR